jgi:hypothetical protein
MQMEMFVAVFEEGSARDSLRERVLDAAGGQHCGPQARGNRRRLFELTEAGESLYKHTKQMLTVRQQAVSELRDLSSIRAGRLRIGANESTSLHLFPHRARFPAILQSPKSYPETSLVWKATI